MEHRRFSSGLLAPSGSYFDELEASGQKLARKIVIIE